VNDVGISITKYYPLSKSRPLKVVNINFNCYKEFNCEGGVNIAKLNDCRLLDCVFINEETVIVWTPAPEGVKLVILKFDDILGVLAKIMELMTIRYCVAPDVSEISPSTAIVTKLPETVHIFVKVVVPK